MSNKKKIKIFISYSHRDENEARKLYSTFVAERFQPWFDKESLLPGQQWEDEIIKAISDSDFITLVLSKNSIDQRGYFQKEIRLALEVFQTIPNGHIFILPARIDNCPIPETLKSIHCVDMFPSWNEGVSKMLKAIYNQSKCKSHLIDDSKNKQKMSAKISSAQIKNEMEKLLNFQIPINQEKLPVVIKYSDLARYLEKIAEEKGFELIKLPIHPLHGRYDVKIKINLDVAIYILLNLLKIRENFYSSIISYEFEKVEFNVMIIQNQKYLIFALKWKPKKNLKFISPKKHEFWKMIELLSLKFNVKIDQNKVRNTINIYFPIVM